MKKLNLIIILIISFSISSIMAQQSRKSIAALRTNNAPKIDGHLDDTAWQTAPIANDFVMYRPGNGNPEYVDYKTTIMTVYDDEGIYFAAYMKDPNPETIPRQYTARDNFGQSDFFGIIINPYDDNITEMEFFVMSTGIQADALSIEDQEDDNWSQVWKSAVKIVDDGWIVEVKIPYAALRFSNKKVQNWGLNFHRRIRAKNEQFSWNFIDKTKGFRSQQAGLLTNLKELSPPLRLSFSPYTFFSAQQYNGTNNTKVSAGMDLKYGISDSYTLDATLIPDFGQTTFDNDALNLSPFEQQFIENRSFFTEGTALFSIGDLFYSRRVGAQPKVNSSIPSGKELINVPTQTPLLNATKLSGRNQKGLGIGFFNAITKKSFATLKTQETGTIENFLLSPNTNFNVLVLDQQFNTNSSISFVNTNVFRKGTFRKANVSALLLNLVNTKNFYVKAEGKMSVINEQAATKKGYSSVVSIGKNNGAYQFELSDEWSDDSFNSNDLGFLLRNNYHNIGATVSYRIFEPTNYFNAFNIQIAGKLSSLFTPAVYTGNTLTLNATAITKNQTYLSTQINGKVGNQKNYFYKSLRVDDTYFSTPSELTITNSIKTDSRKKISFFVSGTYTKQLSNNTTNYAIIINPSIRFTNRFSLNYQYALNRGLNQKGYVLTDEQTPIFGNRNEKIIENSLQATYFLTTKASVNLSLRHFWSPVQYDGNYFSLNEQGDLNKLDYNQQPDINYNSWNLDLNFSWEFAPGSQLVAQYRNSIQSQNNQVPLNFSNNLNALLDESARTNFSIKFLYFLDANNLLK